MVQEGARFCGSKTRCPSCYGAGMNADQYSYRVRFSEEDQQFVGTCLEFPSLSHLDEGAEAALQGIERLVGGVLAEMAKTGETPPARAARRVHRWEDIKRSKGDPEREERVQKQVEEILRRERFNPEDE